ncbi:MAG: helix-turn-helix transcriptional regulator [Oceanospirillaceae bacterium]|nr:helix-turn-helix transcriptional regulator [Oceanospirillaceae bacterium]MCP5334662.1 helix-turn-helix transcriptional regulator [Oceanospirillaceae bacterium]
MDAQLFLAFGQNVKKIRLQKGLSQEELGALSDLDRTYVSGIERGKRNVSLLNIAKIAKALDVSISELVDFEVTDGN